MNFFIFLNILYSFIICKEVYSIKNETQFIKNKTESNEGNTTSSVTIKPDISGSTQVSFLFHIGNISVNDICQISDDDYTKLTEVYPQICSKVHITTESISNENDTCQQSFDLPAVGTVEQEHLSSLSLFLILLVLAICVLLIFVLLRTKLNYLPESVACVIVGAVIGLILKIMYRQNIADWQGNFFQNIGSILTFAVVGTVISALVIGGGIYLLGEADVVYKLTFVESFAFGSLISAVDPVATLAIFHALNVDQVLYMLVFGESILNDAVSIVLTNTILKMASADMSHIAPGEAILLTVWQFCITFTASAGIGALFAICSALLLKHVPLREYASLELCIILIFIYAPYALAEGINMSGIMAILFNGIVMSHYTHFNLSPVMQITMQHLMRTLAFIAECTVFIYLGLALFSFHHQFHLALVLWSIVLCLLGRAFNIFPLSCVVNKFRDHQITTKMMFIMWFSGLRGAIAYALSLHLEFSDEKRHVIVTTTLIIVLFTVFFLGGSTMPLIKYLRAEKKKNRSRRVKHSEKELTLSKTREWGQAVDSEHLSEFTEEESDVPITKRLRGFIKLDLLYLRPFLVRRVTHQEVRSHAIDLKKQCYQSINVQPSDSEEEVFNVNA